MTSKADWIALAERCEKATGIDHLIDVDIYAAALVTHSLPGLSVTASLDAITALIERELPEAEFNSTSKVQGDGMGGLKRYAYAWLVIGPRHYASNAVASEALGRAATLCRAMAEKAA